MSVNDDRPATGSFDLSAFSGNIGSDLRSLRKAKSVTLADLSSTIGRSVGYLSQVERGLSVPSVQDLARICDVLEVPIGWFLQHRSVPEHERGVVVRKGMRRKVGNTEDGLVEELLSPDIGGTFEMILSAFSPGARSGGLLHRPTEETAYMLSGTLEITVDGKRHTVQAGDSFSVKNQPFTWHNPTTETALAVWTIAPPVY